MRPRLGPRILRWTRCFWARSESRRGEADGDRGVTPMRPLAATSAAAPSAIRERSAPFPIRSSGRSAAGEPEIPTRSLTKLSAGNARAIDCARFLLRDFGGEVCRRPPKPVQKGARPGTTPAAWRLAGARSAEVTTGATTSGVSAALAELHPQIPSSKIRRRSPAASLAPAAPPCSEGGGLQKTAEPE